MKPDRGAGAYARPTRHLSLVLLILVSAACGGTTSSADSGGTGGASGGTGGHLEGSGGQGGIDNAQGGAGGSAAHGGAGGRAGGGGRASGQGGHGAIGAGGEPGQTSCGTGQFCVGGEIRRAPELWRRHRGLHAASGRRPVSFGVVLLDLLRDWSGRRVHPATVHPTRSVLCELACELRRDADLLAACRATSARGTVDASSSMVSR